jgi:hypothetical protein
MIGASIEADVDPSSSMTGITCRAASLGDVCCESGAAVG